jgi:protein-tyrosine phosphatase
MDRNRFDIAIIAVPGGGEIGFAPLPGRNGLVAEDIAAIVAFGPAVAVSMTEAEEMARAGVADLPDRLAAHGVAWRHFPVVDYGAPAADDPRWPPLASELHGALDAGGRVFLHCHGGRGRSGMVALRLLVERGLQPAAALAAIRAARPGAVETEAQEDWGQRAD